MSVEIKSFLLTGSDNRSINPENAMVRNGKYGYIYSEAVKTRKRNFNLRKEPTEEKFDFAV